MKVKAKAMERSRLEAKYQELWEKVVDHLVLLCAWPSHDARAHWVAEIKAWVGRLRRFKLKGTNRPPTPENVREWLDDYYPSEPETVGLLVEAFQVTKGLPAPERSPREVARCVDELQERLMEFVTRQQSIFPL